MEMDEELISLLDQVEKNMRNRSKTVQQGVVSINTSNQKNYSNFGTGQPPDEQKTNKIGGYKKYLNLKQLKNKPPPVVQTLKKLQIPAHCQPPEISTKYSKEWIYPSNYLFDEYSIPFEANQ